MTNAIYIEYILDGPRNAAAVVRDESVLLGAVIVVGNTVQIVPISDLHSTLRGYGLTPRVYHDVTLGRVIEHHYDLPSIDQVHDTQIMLRLLDETQAYPTPFDNQLGRFQEILSQDFQESFTVKGTWNIADWLSMLCNRIQQEGLGSLYSDIELPIAILTASIVYRGMRVDTARLTSLLNSHQLSRDQAIAQGTEILGRCVNVDSYEELSTLLYRELGLPILEYTDSGNPSTSLCTLEMLATQHPVVAALYPACRARNVINTLTSIHSSIIDGRVHANLDPLGAVTGRYICTHPNLQGLTQECRQVFTPDEGYTLIESDLSQTELRILAHFTQDPNLLEVFRRDLDVHRRTTAQILGVAEDRITPEQRNSIGKPVNFGIIYGQSAYGLANQLNVAEAQAQTLIDRYFSGFPAVFEWIQRVKQTASHHGYVQTLLGRKRRFPPIPHITQTESSRIERQAVNAVIQGTGADIMKMKLLDLHAALPSDCHILMTVHDSVLIQVPTCRVQEMRRLLKSVSEHPIGGFSVPLVASVFPGLRWSECKEGASVH